MNSSRAVVVVGPGCPAGLLHEFLESQSLPVRKNVEVLLAPGFRPDGHIFTGREISLAASPGGRFLSTSHLKWLKQNLQAADSVVMLLSKSPYQDPAIALVSLLILWWSGKTVTLMRPAPETGEGDGGWLLTELNQGFLSQELRDLAWASYPGFLKKFFTFTERELRYYFEAYQTDPVNLQPLDASPEALERDVDYAMGTATIWIHFLPGNESFLKGKKVLEIGPGINFGNILALASHGAEVLVADRFLSPWDPEYHPKFYARLRERVKERWPASDLTLFDTILAKGGYPRESITIYTSSLEELAEAPDQSLDLIISNAVFEHLYDIESAFAHLARITRPGGLGLHQVDFRDHRDYDKPLEHLLLSERDFSREFKERHGECGNRFRPQEMKKFFESAHFEVQRFMPNLFADEEYLADFVRRLGQARKSRYRDFNAGDLREISGLFTVVKKPNPGD